MDYRLLSAITLIAMVVLAGCSGGIPFVDNQPTNETTTDSAATTQPAATDTPIPSTSVATTTDAVTGTEANSISFPPGYSPSGVTDPKRAITNHFSTLFSYDSFTFTTKKAYLQPTSLPRSIMVAQIDISDKRAYTDFSTTYPEVTRNGTTFPNDTLYVREEYQSKNIYYKSYTYSSTLKYAVKKRPFMDYVKDITDKTSPKYSVIISVLKNVRFGNAERVVRDGETLLRYESTELLNERALLPPIVSDATVNDFNATILVDRNGIIRSATYMITYKKSNGKQLTTTATTRISRINATTVEKPAWLDEAKARTDQSPTGTGPGSTTTTGTDFAVESPASVDEPSVAAPSAQGERTTAPVRQR